MPWKDAKLVVNYLPDYVLLNLVFSDACFQNNSPDVSFPIDSSVLLDCSGNSIDNNELTSELGELTSDKLIVEDFDEVSPDEEEEPVKKVSSHEVVEIEERSAQLVTSQHSVSHQSKIDTDASTTPSRSKTSSKAPQKSTALMTESNANTSIKAKSVKSATVVKPKHVDKENSVSIRSVVTSKPKPPSSISYENKSEKILDETVVVEGNFSTSNQTHVTAREVADVNTTINPITAASVLMNSETTRATSKNVSLFNTREVGIEKTCSDSSSKMKSETDLFTISIKPSRGLTLYDIHCYAAVNSEITISLSQLGQVLRTFNIALNKGENQIGLTSLGLLESNEAYLLECKTKNKGDVYLFTDCKSSGNYSNEVLIRYIDNHTAFYGLTYETEIE